MSSNYNSPSVQPEDSRTVDEAVDSRVSKRVKDRIEDDNQEIETVVRELIAEADDALAGDSPFDAEEVLHDIHYYLRHDDRLAAVLSPQNDDVEHKTKIQFRNHMRLRDGGKTPPTNAEFKTAVKVAKALQYIYSYADTTRYIPVRMEKLDLPGAKSTVKGDPTPIGRRRIGKSQKLDETAEEVLINHDDCEHVLVVALPRKGKDSTIVNICGNLKDEHGYKWFSCLDDGRNETPMTAIPNDEPPIKDNLEQFNQGPKAYDSRVYVPDTDGVPDVLPSNFERFTIGIDTLTPRLILRLAGISTDDANTMRRIGQALEETQRRGLGVEQLVELLYEYSEEVEATITVTELQQDEFVEGDDGATLVDDADAVEQDPSVREVRYEMDADDALEEVAESLLMLAGEGLIADPGAETNLDIVEEFTHQDRVAVLNCNFLKPRNEGLKFVVLNLWLRLIFRARDEQPRLPRAALEIRELKDIAPSVLGNSKYKKEVKALQSTIYEIATRGGSRRILMLGSTQKLNDVYKPVRTNMPVKILLQLGEEEIMTLDRAYNFSPRQRDQLTEFSVGQGMLMTNGEAHWPIQWRGARCGLGLGDETWRDRYGEAWGARVIKNHSKLSTWKRKHTDCEVYINARTGRLKPVDISNDTQPDLGEWFLLVEDLFDGVQEAIARGDIEPPDKIDRRLIEAALEARRETEIPSDLGLRRTQRKTERSLSFAGADEANEQEKRQILSKYDVPKSLEGLIGSNVRQTRQNMFTVIEAIERAEPGELTSMADLADASGIPKGTIGRWRTNRKDFAEMLDKKNGEWVSTAVGQHALKIDWRDLDRML
jgi:hypothetical protein